MQHDYICGRATGTKLLGDINNTYFGIDISLAGIFYLASMGQK